MIAAIAFAVLAQGQKSEIPENVTKAFTDYAQPVVKSAKGTTFNLAAVEEWSKEKVIVSVGHRFEELVITKSTSKAKAKSKQKPTVTETKNLKKTTQIWRYTFKPDDLRLVSCTKGGGAATLYLTFSLANIPLVHSIWYEDSNTKKYLFNEAKSTDKMITIHFGSLENFDKFLVMFKEEFGKLNSKVTYAITD